MLQWPSSIQRGACRKAGEGLFIVAYSDGLRGNSFMLEEGRFLPNIQSKFFTVRVGEMLEQVAQNGYECLAVEAFKARLDGALSSLVQWVVSLSIAEGLELGDLKGPFQPKPFYEAGVVIFCSDFLFILGQGKLVGSRGKVLGFRLQTENIQTENLMVLSLQHEICLSRWSQLAGK